MNKNYDQSVSKLIEEWVSLSGSEYERNWKRALSRFVIPEIYNKVRTEILNQSALITDVKYDYQVGLKKIVFSILWLLKWSWFKVFAQKTNVIVCSLNLSQYNSVRYIDSILDFSRKYKITVVHFNSSLQFRHLFKLNLFCFPYSLFKFAGNKKGNTEILKGFEIELDQLCKKEFGFEFNGKGKLDNLFIRLNRMHLTFDEMVDKILKSSNKLEFYFTDGDFSSNKVLFNMSCTRRNIKTVSIDHSFIFNNSYHLNTFSEYNLVWGKYQADRIEKYYDQKPREIIVVGKPKTVKKDSTYSLKGKSVVYYFSSFQNPLFQSVYRSLDYTLTMAHNIRNSIKSDFQQYKFFVKPHPADHINEKMKTEGFNIWGLDSKPSDEICLVIAEDSSVCIDLLGFSTNILYIKDSNNADNIGFESNKSVCTMVCTDDFAEVFQKMKFGENDVERNDMIEYYSGSDYDSKFRKALLFIIEDQSSLI